MKLLNKSLTQERGKAVVTWSRDSKTYVGYIRVLGYILEVELMILKITYFIKVSWPTAMVSRPQSTKIQNIILVVRNTF